MEISDLYSTRIQNTFDEDYAEILSIFREEFSKSHKLDVRLINYHKGLPISYPATVVGVERDTIELDVYPQQAVTLADHRYTFIRSNLFKHDIFANIQYVNIKKRAATLQKLCYVEIMAEKRNYVRLELDQPQNALFMTDDGTVRGKLIELSINGAGVLIEQPCSMERGQETNLMFMLHDLKHDLNYNVKTMAKLVGISGDRLPRYYRFAIKPDKILDRQIAQFIFQRQIEIIQDIKNAAE